MAAETASIRSDVGIAHLASSTIALSLAPRDEKGIPDLTPGYWRLSVSTGGMVNRFIRLVYQLFDTLLRNSGDPYLLQHLRETLAKTRESFEVQVPAVVEAYQRYVAHLDCLRKGSVPDTTNLVADRHVISDWNYSMRAPKGLSLQDMINAANEGFRAITEDKEKSGGFFFGGDSLLTYHKRFDQIAGCQQIIELEENVGSLPVGVLQKLAIKNSQLTVEEADTLKQWIEKVNGCWRVDVRKLHRGLKALCEHLGMSTISKSGKPSELARMEKRLRDSQLSALIKPDGKHLTWRRGVELSGKVSITGTEYAIDVVQTPKRKGGGAELHWTFPVVDDPKHAIEFGINEAALGMRIADEADQGGPVPYARLYAMDGYGRCALAERLTTAMDEKVWASAEGSFSKSDKGPVKQIAGFLRILSQMEKTPEVKASEVFFNDSGELKLRHPMKPGRGFDFPRLVGLAYEASNGNQAVFTQILKEGGLAEHSVVGYFLNVVEDAIKGTEGRGAMKLAALKEISDPAVCKQAKSLARKTQELQTRCVLEINQRYQPEGVSKERIDELVGQTIVAHYKKSIGAGILWPTLSMGVIDAVAAKLHLIKRT
jgi:hypothetical protein